MPSVSLVVLGESRTDETSSFILMTTCPVVGVGLSNNLVHAKSSDD